MTITVSKSELLQKLQAVARLIPQKPSIPIIGYFLFEAKNGQLIITGMNDEGRATTEIDCKIEGDVSICVSTTIMDGLKNIPEQPIMIDIDESMNIHVRYQGGRFDLVGLAPTTYPQRIAIDPIGEINMEAHDFYDGLSKVINLAATGDLRPIISSVFVEANPDAIHFVATDGHGMGFLKYPTTGERISVVISRSISSFLKNILPNRNGEIEIRIGTERTEIQSGDLFLSFRHIEGKYPNWRSVIPAGNTLVMTADTKQLIGAIKRTLVFSDKASSLLVLNIKNKKLTVKAQDVYWSTSAEESVDIEFNGDNFDIGLNGALTLEIMSNIDSDRVMFSFSDPSKAVLVKPESKDNKGRELTYLIMPMTINY